jgi:N-acetylglucosamine-6-phosphate deacetylase
MIVIAGGDLVLSDRLLPDASLLIEGSTIAGIEPQPRVDMGSATVVDARQCYVVPGFIDVHVHGVGAHDTLDAGDPISEIASRLPRYGVTAFCPTTVACGPADLRRVLQRVAHSRANRPLTSARVLPAHLESNFINPEFKGAQPVECLRTPIPAPTSTSDRAEQAAGGDSAFSADDILDVIDSCQADVGIITLAPELPGAMELIDQLFEAGYRVSLGHSGASYEQALAAIEAGACHATHLFNRMTGMTHRAPGLAGAVLARPDVAAELICDGYHVHPSMSRVAINAKGVDRMMAITDGTGGSGLPVGSTATLGGRRIRVTDRAVVLDDGTLAGSTLTMDRAFRTIVEEFGCSVVEAARLCSTTPARELALVEHGVLARDAVADVVLLDRTTFRVVRTFVDGREVYRSGGEA